MLVLSVCVVIPVSTNAAVSGDFSYEITDGSYVTITKYNGNAQFPGTFEGFPVEVIGQKAFSSNLEMVDVKIPDTVTEIADFAFEATRSLEKVKLPRDLEKIGKQASIACTSLSSIEFNKKLKSIGDNAFAVCTKLSAIYLPDGLETVGSSPFSTCSLFFIRIPHSLKTSFPLNIGKNFMVVVGCRGSLAETMARASARHLPQSLVKMHFRVYHRTKIIW